MSFHTFQHKLQNSSKWVLYLHFDLNFWKITIFGMRDRKKKSKTEQEFLLSGLSFDFISDMFIKKTQFLFLRIVWRIFALNQLLQTNPVFINGPTDDFYFTYLTRKMASEIDLEIDSENDSEPVSCNQDNF